MIKNGITDSIKENHWKLDKPKLKNTLYISPTEPLGSIVKDPILHRNKRKKVKFIDSESVSIYGPPPVYESVNTKDVIDEYINSCEKLKTKPLDSIINQLGKYEVIKGRIPQLNLNGIRIDFKSAESLEPIFVSVQTEKLFLEGTMIDESTCETLCGIIAFYSSTRALSIGSNTRIGLRGWYAISDMVSRSFELVELNLNRMIFTEQSVEPLSKAIRKSQSLRVLRLANCYLNGSRLKHLLQGIAEGGTIEELYLAENKICASDCHYIADVIKQNRSLRVLDLESNPIQDLGIKHICSMLIRSEVTGLEVLQLWNTGLTSIGMRFLSDYLRIKQFGHRPITFASLNLGKNKICDDGLLALKYSLIQNNSLKRLGLASTKLSPPGVIVLAEIILDNKSVTRVDLRDNNINMAGMLALSQALKHNITILKINFSESFKIETGMEIEFKNVLKEISMKCNENLEKARSCGRIEDNLSIFSAISHESVALNSTHSGFPSMASVIMHFITTPWRLTKFKIFNSNKIDAEKNINIAEQPKKAECVDKKKNIGVDVVPKNSSANVLSLPLDLKDEFLPLPTNSYTVSRFQVSQVRNPKPTHRRWRSENLRYKPIDIISNPDSIEKLNKKETQIIDRNVIIRDSMISYQSQDNNSVSSMSSSSKSRLRSSSADLPKNLPPNLIYKSEQSDSKPIV